MMNIEMEPVQVDEKKRRQRSVAIAWAIVALIVLFFIVTLVQLGANVFNRPL